MAAARAGEPAALDALVSRYQQRVYRFGVRICGNPDDGGEVAQDTLLQLVKSVRDFRGEASLSTWLYTVARSVCIKRRRRSKFAPAREESLEALGDEGRDVVVEPGRGPEQALLGRELEAAVDRSIGALGEEQREVLVLRDVEGLTAPETAEVLGISVQAVKSRLHRARVSLRETLAPMIGILPTPEKAPCRDIVSMFSRHLEGDLSPDACAEMERHMAECSGCREACESLRATLLACRSQPLPELPAQVEQSVRRAIRVFLSDRTPSKS